MDARPLYLWSLADLFHWLVHVPMLAILGVLVLCAFVIKGLRAL